MKIGVVTSGNENLLLFTFLHKYAASYVVYYDSEHWPYDDKSFGSALAYVKKGVDYLLEQGCEAIIVAPVFEMYFKREKQYDGKILPLFVPYFMESLNVSLVGKIGLCGDHASLEVAQDLCAELAKSHKLTPNQQATKKFQKPFAWRVREVPLWNYLLRRLSPKQYMVDKIVKADLKYFKDAAVDTLMPLQYSYFAYEKTIVNFLNRRKYKFHRLEMVEAAFEARYSAAVDTSGQYEVSLFATGSKHMLAERKRLVWLLERGKETSIKYLT